MFRALKYLAPLLAGLPLPLMASTNNLALTPPMGWNDWNAYGCGITESIVTNNAGVIVADGLKAAGYQYVNIDDCWQTSRNASGVIVANPSSFPDGMPWLADYIHSMGLKFGLYTDHGSNTCQGKPGSYGFEYLDAFTYANWGVDYLKEDDCNAGGLNAEADYGRMSDGLMKSGRPILLCLCGNGANTKGYDSWSPVLGNQWRTTGDISANYATMISHLDPNSTTAFAAGPGRWNDPDMLEVGNGMTSYQDQTHFTMWCMMAAPLIMGNKLTEISAAALATLTNSEAIAVDQDPAGEEGVKVINYVTAAATNEVWARTLGYDFSTKAVALLNRWGPPASITVNWTNIGLQAGAATVRDLLLHTNLGTFTNGFTEVVASNSAALLKIVGTPPALPVMGTNYLTGLQAVYTYTGYGTIVPNKSIAGNPITLGGVVYTNGIGVNSFSGLDYDLGGICSQFHATIGVDGDVGAQGSVIFQVFADGTEIYDSGVMTGGEASQTINLDVTGVRRLILGVGDADDNINYDHGDWANACVVVTNTTPQVPHAPTGLVANPGNPITLTWAPTVCATNYNIKRSFTSGGPYTPIGTSPVNEFADTNIVTGPAYYYVVSAVSSIGESSNSTEAAASMCIVPSAPANITVTVVSNQEASVTWNASAGASSYTVSRFTGRAPPQVIAGGLTATNFTDTNMPLGTACYYQVAASSPCNQSPPATAFIAAAVFPPTPIWNGGGGENSNWTDNANWNGVAVTAGDTLAFGGENLLDNYNDTAPATLYSSIVFNSNSGSFVLNGNPIDLGKGITNNSSMPQMVNFGLNFSNSICLDGASNTLFIIGGLTNLLGESGNTVTLAGTGVMDSLLAATPGGTNYLAVNAGANWTMLNNSSSTPVTAPWIPLIYAGTFNFGSAESAPIFTSSAVHNGPQDSQVGGTANASATLNVVNGTLSLNTLDTGTALDATGIVNVVGGTLNIGPIGSAPSDYFQGANSGNLGEASFVNISGGMMDLGSGPFYVASRDNGALTLSGAGALICGKLDISRNAYGNTEASVGVVNLNGGTLTVTRVGTATANQETGGTPAATFNFNGGTLMAAASSATFYQGSTASPVCPITSYVLAGGAVINDGGNSITFLEPLQSGAAPDGGLTKLGNGTVTLGEANTYSGHTTIKAGTLALSGSGSIANSAAIVIAGGAAFDVSGLSSFTLGANQVLSNNTSTATIAGNFNTGSGTLSLTHAPGTPALSIASGTFALSATTTVNINDTGAVLSPGVYPVITAGGGTVGGTPPSSVTVAGGGLAAGTTTSLQISGGALNLVITPPLSPVVFTSVAVNGNTLTIAATNGPDGGQFVLLESTNLALPVNQWTPILTNHFAGNGSLNLSTNIINSNNPQEFYLLQLP